MTIAALLFDLDGTLIDSMPLHGSAWQRWHAERGLPFDHDAFFAATAGRANEEILPELLPQAGAQELQQAARRKEALYREIAAHSLELIDGFAALHRQARAQGLKLAICTAAPPQNIAIADARFGLNAMMDTVVSPADGLRGKPHPDIFLEAARRLGVAPAHCLVFEDAPLGVEAARRAGMRAVALTTSMQAGAFSAYANVVAAITDFSGFQLSTLGEQPKRKTP